MTDTQISIRVPEGELKAILEQMEEARKTIYECYLKLGALGYVEITKEEQG